LAVFHSAPPVEIKVHVVLFHLITQELESNGFDFFEKDLITLHTEVKEERDLSGFEDFP
jgi:hypothetical protein